MFLGTRQIPSQRIMLDGIALHVLGNSLHQSRFSCKRNLRAESFFVCCEYQP